MVQEDSRFALCNTCKLSISCGGKMAKTFNAINLVTHLKSKHQDVFRKYEEKQKGLTTQGSAVNKGKGKMSQVMLQESIESTKLLDVTHPRAQIIHK